MTFFYIYQSPISGNLKLVQSRVPILHKFKLCDISISLLNKNLFKLCYFNFNENI